MDGIQRNLHWLGRLRYHRQGRNWISNHRRVRIVGWQTRPDRIQYPAQVSSDAFWFTLTAHCLTLFPSPPNSHRLGSNNFPIHHSQHRVRSWAHDRSQQCLKNRPVLYRQKHHRHHHLRLIRLPSALTKQRSHVRTVVQKQARTRARARPLANSDGRECTGASGRAFDGCWRARDSAGDCKIIAVAATTTPIAGVAVIFCRRLSYSTVESARWRAGVRACVPACEQACVSRLCSKLPEIKLSLTCDPFGCTITRMPEAWCQNRAVVIDTAVYACSRKKTLSGCKSVRIRVG